MKWFIMGVYSDTKIQIYHDKLNWQRLNIPEIAEINAQVSCQRWIAINRMLGQSSFIWKVKGRCHYLQGMKIKATLSLWKYTINTLSCLQMIFIEKKKILISREGKGTNFMAPFREQILFFQHSCLDYRCKHIHASVSVVKCVDTSQLSVCSKQTHAPTDPKELKHKATYWITCPSPLYLLIEGGGGINLFTYIPFL